MPASASTSPLRGRTTAIPPKRPASASTAASGRAGRSSCAPCAPLRRGVRDHPLAREQRAARGAAQGVVELALEAGEPDRRAGRHASGVSASARSAGAGPIVPTTWPASAPGSPTRASPWASTVPSRASIAARVGIRVWRARRSPGRRPGTTSSRASRRRARRRRLLDRERERPRTVPKIRVRARPGPRRARRRLARRARSHRSSVSVSRGLPVRAIEAPRRRAPARRGRQQRVHGAVVVALPGGGEPRDRSAR